jgi:hypothetical protein
MSAASDVELIGPTRKMYLRGPSLVTSLTTSGAAAPVDRYGICA